MILPDGRRLRIPDDWLVLIALILAAAAAVIIGPDGLFGIAPNVH